MGKVYHGRCISKYMARTRGILTETDREALSGERDVSHNRLQQIRWEVRKRIEDEVPTDVEILAAEAPELLLSLREEVCDD
jgi:hypothetical protein